ncbi:hypothetical protein MGAST_23670 [Mycobacterium gastri 'Wayne']|uniref:ANTAR domain-containing protein n=1 Tax=Mycobacterium gastri TaxID=1777 RepID=A0A1X1VLG3_MYCGS|nr:hypothetical protein MGAST_23670 [Mycobacterium gastri 'Wayne']ORV69825.1 hypothetical protein AWC07_06185 [Mycobacterium gastri]
MHGYEPGSVVPTTKLLLSHKHPDDRAHVQDLLVYRVSAEQAFRVLQWRSQETNTKVRALAKQLVHGQRLRPVGG